MRGHAVVNFVSEVHLLAVNCHGCYITMIY